MKKLLKKAIFGGFVTSSILPMSIMSSTSCAITKPKFEVTADKTVSWRIGSIIHSSLLIEKYYRSDVMDPIIEYGDGIDESFFSTPTIIQTDNLFSISLELIKKTIDLDSTTISITWKLNSNIRSETSVIEIVAPESETEIHSVFSISPYDTVDTFGITPINNKSMDAFEAITDSKMPYQVNDPGELVGEEFDKTVSQIDNMLKTDLIYYTSTTQTLQQNYNYIDGEKISVDILKCEIEYTYDVVTGVLEDCQINFNACISLLNGTISAYYNFNINAHNRRLLGAYTLPTISKYNTDNSYQAAIKTFAHSYYGTIPDNNKNCVISNNYLCFVPNSSDSYVKYTYGPDITKSNAVLLTNFLGTEEKVNFLLYGYSPILTASDWASMGFTLPSYTLSHINNIQRVKLQIPEYVTMVNGLNGFAHDNKKDKWDKRQAINQQATAGEYALIMHQGWLSVSRDMDTHNSVYSDTFFGNSESFSKSLEFYNESNELENFYSYQRDGTNFEYYTKTKDSEGNVKYDVSDGLPWYYGICSINIATSKKYKNQTDTSLSDENEFIFRLNPMFYVERDNISDQTPDQSKVPSNINSKYYTWYQQDNQKYYNYQKDENTVLGETYVWKDVRIINSKDGLLIDPYYQCLYFPYEFEGENKSLVIHNDFYDTYSYQYPTNKISYKTISPQEFYKE